MGVSIGSLTVSAKRSNVQFRLEGESVALIEKPQVIHFEFLGWVTPKLLCLTRVTMCNNHVINRNNKQSYIIPIL